MVTGTKRASVARRLAAYSLAAGVSAGAATGADGAMLHYDNGGAGWFDARPHFGGTTGGYDMILFKMDGTVLVDDAQIDPTLPNAPSIELMGESYNGIYHWGDGKTRDTAFLRTRNAGVVGTYWNDSPEATKLSDGATVGSCSGFVTGDVGLYGYGWYSVVGGFGGRGYLGFYLEDGASNRHYGWADLHVNGARNEFTLHSFTVSDTPNVAVVVNGWGWSHGDFNGDGDINAEDVQLLCDNIGGDPTVYDVDGDCDVDEDDLVYLIENLVWVDSDGDGIPDGRGTRQADVNLDGIVDATDMTIMAQNFGDTGKSFADGNLNCDDVINGTDLAILQSHFGFVASGAPGSPADVPEPITFSLLALGAMGLTAKRQLR